MAMVQTARRIVASTIRRGRQSAASASAAIATGMSAAAAKARTVPSAGATIVTMIAPGAHAAGTAAGRRTAARAAAQSASGATQAPTGRAIGTAPPVIVIEVVARDMTATMIAAAGTLALTGATVTSAVSNEMIAMHVMHGDRLIAPASTAAPAAASAFAMLRPSVRSAVAVAARERTAAAVRTVASTLRQPSAAAASPQRSMVPNLPAEQTAQAMLLALPSQQTSSAARAATVAARSAVAAQASRTQAEGTGVMASQQRQRGSGGRRTRRWRLMLLPAATWCATASHRHLLHKLLGTSFVDLLMSVLLLAGRPAALSCACCTAALRLLSGAARCRCSCMSSR